MTTPATKLTYHDYLLLPDDGKRYEILEGELYITPSPMTRHQLIAFRLSHVFMAYLETHPIGTGLAAPCDVILSETDVVQPDLFVVLHGGIARITDKNVQGPPDLVVEILSPGTSARDRDLKRKRYEYFRVREYWLVDPDANSIETLTLQGDRFVRLNLFTPPASCTSPLFPDLKIDLAWLLK
jgi:Uma2 family endonuclease